MTAGIAAREGTWPSAGVRAEDPSELGASTLDKDGQAGVNLEAPLAAALIHVGRTDIRAGLVRIGIMTVAEFLDSTVGIEDGASVISVGINKQMRAAGERILAEETLRQIREFCKPKQPEKDPMTEAAGKANKRGVSPKVTASRARGRGRGKGEKKSTGNIIDGCEMKGAEGKEWVVLKKETARLPSAPDRARSPPQTVSERERRKRESQQPRGQGDAPDVYYVEGDMPIVIGVPFAGSVGWPNAGSPASVKDWAGFGNGFAERR